jgi:sortase A
MPGQGELVYVAGHRTTYGAPFADIDELRRGDPVSLRLPYATIVYEVTGHVIVPATDLARLKSQGREQLALQACHPRFFASHRYIVYARPVEVRPRRGTPYRVGSTASAAASQAKGK